ncbi:MAG: 23S rRNA methyltransferase [Mariprofundaceae bacterium]|nr:23S rRNA methyltransferase [Mariprofundaceae bacterium]
MRASDQLFLVANSVPGDLISFTPGRKRRGAARGRLVEVIEGAASRVLPPCPVAEQCGGCAMQYLHPDIHSEIKSGWVFDAFHPCQHENTVRVPAGPVSQHGRRRLRWYVGEDGKGCFLGFRAKTAHTVVRHDACMCATPALDTLRRQLEASAVAISLSSFDSVQAVELDDGIHVILEGVPSLDESAIPCHEINGLPLQWWHRSGEKTVPLSKPVQRFHDVLPAGDEGQIVLQIGPDDFVQGQVEGNREIVAQLLRWCEGAGFVVDLFSGTGNLSLPVASALAARVAGAELSQASVRAANANAGRLGVDASYLEANLFERFSIEPFAGADVLILDPPRRGAKNVCSMMGSLLPAKIIMVNCDAASGGRDGRILQSLGYRLHTLRALDLFPYTGHVEAMSLWVR